MSREQTITPPATERAVPSKADFSNAIRLTGWEWVGVGLFALGMVLFTPYLWKEVEKFDPESDYRIPHDLSNDYWLFDRYSQLAAKRYDTLLIGDSVIWGEYVTRQETLSHYLNEQADQERFANLGLDGADPLALEGLVKHYAKGVSGKNVILFCNLLWMSSPRRDLQEEENTDVSHPRLIPQFVPRIPAYHENLSNRIGVLVEQRVPFNSWTSHVQTAYYGGTDIPSWTVEHPYDDPLGPLAKRLPPPETVLRHKPIPWYESGITPQDFPWIDLESSLQWGAFRRTVDVLQKRHNRVFVLVGPFNEHLLAETSLKRYQSVKSAVERWLQETDIAHYVPPTLPSKYYGDASHPLAKGYEALAQQVYQRIP